MRYTSQITFAELACESGENKLTCLYRIFFWNWLGDTADENRLPVKLSWYTSCKVGELWKSPTVYDTRKIGLLVERDLTRIRNSLNFPVVNQRLTLPLPVLNASQATPSLPIAITHCNVTHRFSWQKIEGCILNEQPLFWYMQYVSVF